MIIILENINKALIQNQHMIRMDLENLFNTRNNYGAKRKNT